MHWSEISARQPALGAVADRLLIELGCCWPGRSGATTRSDQRGGTAGPGR